MKDRLKAAMRAITHAANTVKRIFTTQLSALWALHIEALRTRSSYRAEVVALVIGIIGLTAIQPPLDLAVMAAVSAYVAYYSSQNSGQDSNPLWI